jgi:hypothetical protein
MRSLKSRWRIPVVVGASLITAFLEYLLFHMPFVASLIRGLGIYGGITLLLYLSNRPKRPQPQITAEQQPPKIEEQNSSGS